MASHTSKLIGWWSVLLAFVCVGAAHSEEATTLFPGRSAELISPDGAMKLINHDRDDSGHPHTLALAGIGTQNRTLLEYGRHVRAAWAPDSQHLFVTDYTESTDATCVLFSVHSNDRVDLREIAIRSSPEAQRILSYGHDYLECEKWLSKDKILLKLHGYGSSTAMDTLFLEYSVKEASATPVTR